ncbi:MAG: class E sortase [Micrococcales bacterium]|nr:MAG: class E sortase [Micrococcales bacterium]PIE26680.1 MAG: class E sortase [Micrococcales bacterium]
MIRRLTHLTGELMITAGLFLLLFVPWQLWWTTVVAERESRVVAAALTESWAQPEETVQTEQAPVEPPVDQPPGAGEPFGLLHIPRFGSGYEARPIVQGTSVQNLKAGVGHYPDTVMPGAVGNFSVAGHRTTYGAPLNLIADLQPQDALVVETESGWYTYRVTRHEIVAPTQVDVVAPVPGSPGTEPRQRLMTMTSCHPMYSARQRYIIHAEFDIFTPRAAGPPDSLTT